MCKVTNNSKSASQWTMRISRILIITGLTILVVKNGQSMPSRDFRHSAQSQSSEVDLTKEEFDELEGPAVQVPVGRKLVRNKSGSSDVPRNGGRDLTTKKTVLDKDAIQYPGDWERNVPNFAPKPLPDCMGKTFCEDTDSSYPQEYLSNLISGSESLKLLSAVDILEIDTRRGGVDGGELLCLSETKIVYPKTAQNRAKEWLFVLQDEKQDYKQGVKVENCNVGTAEGSCAIIEGSVFGYKTFCKQKYVSRVMAAVHKNGTAVTENFSMPSSCCCQLKLEVGDGVGPRMGGMTLKNQSPAPVQKTPRHH